MAAESNAARYHPVQLALRRCLTLFYESGADLSEDRFFDKPSIWRAHPLDRPLLVQLGADLNEAFSYARDHGTEVDLILLLAMTNGVFDGEPVFPVVVPTGRRLRLLAPRTQAILRLHERSF